jgi:hypothetical protein
MGDLYLIAHKVRGEPAFDVAIQIPCPECDNDPGCTECDGLGYWWIIPTSGHRAYPYWSNAIHHDTGTLWINQGSMVGVNFDIGEMPPSLPDHYTVRADPKAPKRSLLAELGLAKPTGHPAIQGKVTRRI